MRRQHSKSDCDDAFRTTQQGETKLTQEGIVNYLPENENPREGMFVNITLYHVPASLVKEFALKHAYKYSGGISEAVQDLMRNAVKE
jgi:hypothetical protein